MIQGLLRRNLIYLHLFPFSETEAQVAQANLELGTQPKIALNSPSFCLHFLLSAELPVATPNLSEPHLMSQQFMVKEMSSKRNTHRIKVFIDN